MRQIGWTDKTVALKILHRLMLCAILCGSLSSWFSCTSTADDEKEQHTQLERYQYNQLHLGVQVRIVLYAPSELTAKTAAREVFKRIAVLEDIFSHYRPKSELSRLLTGGVRTPIAVSTELFTVLQSAEVLSRETGGAFDITVGPLVDLWRISRTTKALPDEEALSDAFQQVGWEKIQLDAAGQTVRLESPGMKLDMGGIAKGYILDEAIKVLDAAGIQRALIEAGGDIVVSAPPPERDGWRVEISDADTTSAIGRQAMQLKHAALATSGDTEQFIEIEGQRYSHVVNPSTGLGLQTRKMATVIATDGLTADSYATALTVMDSVSAVRFTERHPEIIAFIRYAK